MTMQRDEIIRLDLVSLLLALKSQKMILYGQMKKTLKM